MISEGTKLRQLHTQMFSGTDLAALKIEVDDFLQAQGEAVLQDWKICSLGQADTVAEDLDIPIAVGTADALCIVIFYVIG